jgi:acyl-CoA thioester hydrolase
MTELQPTAGRFEGPEHRLPVRVYYEDTDFTGVVYHASYARFFERGRTDFLRLAGVGHSQLLTLDPPLGFVVTRLAIEFERAARIDDALEVRTLYRLARGARFQVDQSLWRGAERIAAAEVHAACIDLSGRPRRLPPEVTARLKPHLVAAD